MAVRAYILLIITTLGWGGNAIAGKLAAGHISPALLTSGRWLVALAILLPFALPHLRREWTTIRAHFWFLMVLGIVGFALFNNFYYLALNYTSAINGAIEQASMPLLVFIANFVLFGQRVSPGQIFGFFISLVGVALVATHGDLVGILRLDIGYGDALLILSIAFYGAYTVSLRWMPKLHWLSAMTALSVGAIIGGIPFTLWEAASGSLVLPDMQGWLVLAYAAIFPSIISQACFYKGRRADRRQPRRPVHQPGADFRYVLCRDPARRGPFRLPPRRAGAGARRHRARRTQAEPGADRPPRAITR